MARPAGGWGGVGFGRGGREGKGVRGGWLQSKWFLWSQISR